jgi:hypothetical protein
MVFESAYVLWVDEDSAVLYSKGSRRVSLDRFVEPPEKDQVVWMEMDHSWWTTFIKVWPKDPRCGNYWLNRKLSRKGVS